ncbi:hypothetical protein BGX38DRAFT_1209547, partial [Terfezia claveryi]
MWRLIRSGTKCKQVTTFCFWTETPTRLKKGAKWCSVKWNSTHIYMCVVSVGKKCFPLFSLIILPTSLYLATCLYDCFDDSDDPVPTLIPFAFGTIGILLFYFYLHQHSRAYILHTYIHTYIRYPSRI